MEIDNRNSGHKFHLEINNLEDFISFVAVIRGKEIDLNEIQNLTSQLNKSDQKLEAAVKKNS